MGSQAREDCPELEPETQYGPQEEAYRYRAHSNEARHDDEKAPDECEICAPLYHIQYGMVTDPSLGVEYRRQAHGGNRRCEDEQPSTTAQRVYQPHGVRKDQQSCEAHDEQSTADEQTRQHQPLFESSMMDQVAEQRLVEAAVRERKYVSPYGHRIGEVAVRRGPHRARQSYGCEEADPGQNQVRAQEGGERLDDRPSRTQVVQGQEPVAPRVRREAQALAGRDLHLVEATKLAHGMMISNVDSGSDPRLDSGRRSPATTQDRTR